jgi:hypothetical protein
MMERDLYAVLVTPEAGIAPRAVRLSTETRVGHALGILISVHNQPITPEDVKAGHAQVSDDAGQYQVWSWDVRLISHDCRIGQIPKPGVFFVVDPRSLGEGMNISALVMLVKRELANANLKKYERHLSGHWSQWAPQPLSACDVLLSFCEGDKEIAETVAGRLRERRLSVVQTIRPDTLQLGGMEVREQLRDCQVLVSLLTPSSTISLAVVEAGACWVLAKPFVPLLWNLARTELPPSMAARQCVELRDDQAWQRLPGQISLLVEPA